ncbi:sn-glycerol 3-phosphate transport system ATP-binding protein [Ketogulonicigenium robustum]|uniref:sn-glycerol 3-phosphate transport system ATP-binding protein n=1 Tax=Ketogulonicigenium robustum TaxID=92947 RepID=A0A1W6NX59_9RHOB|nr:sn-glycerol-3-phosphate ABC transporter ATP-binding protein UgpC [Ketogulonicigenium robustum]ARO13814.1 sn-glycerol 3-phosphate transport system ATP-binding protein [Ketogulonicigenium robustum]
MSEIAFRGVHKRYNKTDVIHGVDMDIAAGEFIVILGPSGCGKSTLLRMIAGLEGITGGEIAIGGRVVNTLEPRERGCAMVFQNYALYPHMSVAQNIGYALRVAGVGRSERDAKVRDVAKAVGLDAFLDRKPGELSGGQRQRVAMARAMVREPKVFLFDEPFSNLDAKLRVAMRAEVRNLHRRLGVTSVFVTHDQTEAMTLADRLVIMNGGRVEQIGTPSEVYDHPASLFVADFIGAPAMNLIQGAFDGDGQFRHGTNGVVRLQGVGQSVGSRVGQAPVSLGIRPERILRLDAPCAHSVTASVDYIEDLGGARIIYADLAGTTIAIEDRSKDRLTRGAPLHLELAANAVQLFSHVDGRRIPVQ